MKCIVFLYFSILCLRPLTGEITIVDRNEWMATDPISVHRLSLPVPNIILVDTLSAECFEKKDCVKYIRFLQNHNIEAERKSDIIYNFLIGGDGNVYYGRGWEVQSEIVPNCNNASLSIAFIGTFFENKLPKEQITAAKELITTGVQKGFISENYRMVELSQILKLGMTSNNVLEEIKNWPHWISKDFSNDIGKREKFCKGSGAVININYFINIIVFINLLLYVNMLN